MKPAIKLLSCLPLAAGLLFTTCGNAAEPSRYWVIVSASNSVTALSRSDLSHLFLKKTTTWTDRHLVFAVDQSDGAPVRLAFSREIHKRSVSAVKSYWQQRIFSGSDVPPPEFGSDAEVIAYVRTHPGAIGYVLERPLDAGVRPIEITE